MTFVHPLLLGGLALVGIPVLIHLLMRQKPKRLPFPAFRFLLQKHRTNQTRLRLRHLLLLLLRMAVIAALCLALVRPAITGGVLPPLGGDRPVSAVLLIDTSYSMEYSAAGKTRLDEARRRAGELLDELPEGSRVAVLDSAEAGGEWQPSAAQARERIASLKLRHVNAPLTRQVEQAYRLLAELERTQENPAEAPPQVLYVFSDRTRGCWDEGAARALTQPKGVSAVFVDVGVEDPADLAVVEVKTEPAPVRPGGKVRINVTVQATGADYDTAVACRIDDKPCGEPRPLKLSAGRAEVVTFESRAAGRAAAGEAQTDLAEGLHQVEVRLLGSDALPFDNVGFATFRVLGGRRVLILADDTPAAERWKEVIDAACRADVKAVADENTVALDDYAAVCLFNVASPNATLWGRLKDYVAAGGGLVVVLGGGDKGGPVPAAYNGDAAAAELLPARLGQVQKVTGERERFWAEFLGDSQQLARHSLLAPFRRWKNENVAFFTEEGRPRVSKFWKVTPVERKADVLTHYTDKDASPALLERVVGGGRVLMLTTSFDPAEKAWNDYFGESPFGFVLSNLLIQYLVGDAAEPALNFVAGQTVPLPLPAKPFLPTYTLSGPGVIGSDATLTRQPEQRELRVVNATTPGNFAVLAVLGERHGAQRVAAFSINPRPDEHQLDRVPVAQIESLLGEGSVLPVGRTASLRERLQQRWAQPLDLTPWLLIALLLFLAVEALLANRFYRQQPPAEEAPVGADLSVRETMNQGSRLSEAEVGP
jgi:hypothetical protein